MANDYYELLGIASPEAEQVRRILEPVKPRERQVFGSAVDQSYGDYSQQLEEDLARREQQSMQAELARQIMLPTPRGQQARSAAFQKAMQEALYEKQTSALLKDLQALDPGDPDHETFQDEIIAKHPIAKDALRDPRVASIIRRQAEQNAEMQKIFDSDPQARQEYAALRVSETDPRTAQQKVRDNAQRRADRLQFAAMGGKLEDFDSGKFDTPDGRVDKARMVSELAKIKSRGDSILSSTERKMLDEIADDVRYLKADVSDETKKRLFREKYGQLPQTEQDWDAAYELASSVGSDRREKLKSVVSDFVQAGKSVPSIYLELAGMSGEPDRGTMTNVPQDESQSSSPPVITTRAQYEAMKPGERGVDGKGRPFTKK